MAFEVIKSRDDLNRLQVKFKESLDSQSKQILICAGTGCVAGGSLKIYERLQEILKEKNIPCSVMLEEEPHDTIGVKKSGCHGFCEKGPLLRIEPYGWLYLKVKLEDCEEIVEKTIIGDECIDRLVYKDSEGNPYRQQSEIPFYKKQTRLALEHCGQINAESIVEYIAVGGYSAVAKALFDMTSDEIVEEAEASPPVQSGLRCLSRTATRNTSFVTVTKAIPVRSWTVP